LKRYIKKSNRGHRRKVENLRNPWKGLKPDGWIPASVVDPRRKLKKSLRICGNPFRKLQNYGRAGISSGGSPDELADR
jgi:hypothetical protein